MTDHLFQLEDGRTLAYASFGPGNGKPVFYFPGTPSSRLEPLLINSFDKDIEQLLHQYNLQFISVDRPGTGNSTYNPKGTFLSFAKDLNELTEELKITSAASLSWSGGGPYALSQAYHYPGLIKAVFMFTAFTRSLSDDSIFKHMSSNKYYFGAARSIPWLLEKIMKQQGKKPCKKPMPRWLSKWSHSDYNIMNDPKRMISFTRFTTIEAVKHSAKGVVHEARSYFDKPGYVLKEMQQPIHFWWGTVDNVVQHPHAEAIKQSPNHHLYYKEGEGHISIYFNYMEEVLQAIAKENF